MTITNTRVDGQFSNSGTATTASWTSTSGSLIVVVGHAFGQARDPLNGDVVDSKSNTYTVRNFIRNGTNEAVAVWSNQGGTRGASHTVTIQNWTITSINLGIGEYTTDSSWNTPAYDSGTAATATDSTSPLAITAGGAISGSVVAFFGCTIDNGANGSFTPSTGYTTIFDQGNGAGGLTSHSSYKIAETGTPSLSVAYSAAITSAREIFATFSETGSAGGGLPPNNVFVTRQAIQQATYR